jgi:hypothetical protein
MLAYQLLTGRFPFWEDVRNETLSDVWKVRPGRAGAARGVCRRGQGGGVGIPSCRGQAPTLARPSSPSQAVLSQEIDWEAPELQGLSQAARAFLQVGWA